MSRIKKTALTSAWDSAAHSLQSFTGGCFMTANAAQANAAGMIGLNDDPAVDSSYTGINYAWHFRANGVLEIYESGLLVGSFGAYTIATVVSMTYDNRTLRYFKDGVQQRSITPGQNLRFFLDVSLFTTGAELVNIAFGPMGGEGQQGLPGAGASSIRLSSTAQAFVENGVGLLNPASITFTATRQNIATSASWTALNQSNVAVPLTGSGDTRTLTSANFGAATSVRVRAEASGFFDEITVVRLVQGSTNIQGFLTNQAHTLAANPEGVVGDYSSARGQFRVFEGVTERTTDASFTLVSQTGCIAQINNAANTPIPGSPKGTYRVVAVSADQAQAVFRASFGFVDIELTFTVTRARQGQPGDGSNLLPVDDWVIGTTGAQGPGGRWAISDVATESAIVLGGAGTAPTGPFGVSEPLWESRPTGVSGTVDGGWFFNGIPIDPAKTYRSSVWVRVTGLSPGSFYHGCTGDGSTLNLNGTVNSNPYFSGGAVSMLPEPNQWYLSVGVLHGNGYSGSGQGIAGIYDPRTGKRVFAGQEYKSAAAATTQQHRAFHFDNTSSTFRQRLARPRFEEINGNEPTIDQLLGFQRTLPWISSTNCEIGSDNFLRQGSSNAWSEGVYSVQRHRTCHLQFKAGHTNAHFMVGLNSDPASNDSYDSIDFAWYCLAGGGLQIYEGGVLIGDFGVYFVGTEFAITRDAANGHVYYYKDRELVRETGVVVPTPDVPYYLDSSLHTVGAVVRGVKFGPGLSLESVSTGDLDPNAATEILTLAIPEGSVSWPNFSSVGDLVYGFLPFDCIAVLTFTCDARMSADVDSLDTNEGTPGLIYAQCLQRASGPAGNFQAAYVMTSDFQSYTHEFTFPLAKGSSPIFQPFVRGGANDFSATPLTTYFRSATMSIKLYKR